MDTEALTQKCDDIAEFASDKLSADLAQADRNQVFPLKDWQRCADFGLLGLHVPEALRGSGHSALESVKLLEALGYGCPDNGLTLAINGQVWAVQEPILQFGNDDQRQRYLPGLAAGTSIGAHAMTEAEAGSDAFKLATRCRKVAGGFRLTGRKAFVGLAPVADVLLTFATSDPSRGSWGISAFLVDAHAEGVAVGPMREKSGLRTNPMADVEFDEVFVPDADLLGKPGAGATIFTASMDYERSFIFASHVGSMSRQLDQTVSFARERKVGEESISTRQAVSHRIADMRVRLETARLFLYQAAAKVDAGTRIPLESAMTKLVIGEALFQNSVSAVRVYGGRGFMTEDGIERDLRDMTGGLLYSGTSDIQRNVIARLLGL